jgi:hypothetical protein
MRLTKGAGIGVEGGGRWLITYLIDRRAQRFGEVVIIERGGVGATSHTRLVHNPVNL